MKKHEGKFITDEIKKLANENNVSYDDIAILI